MRFIQQWGYLEGSLILMLRVIGAIGALFLAFELYKAIAKFEHDVIKKFIYKVFVFFAAFGIFKSFGVVMDVFLLTDGIISIIVNNVFIYFAIWLVRNKLKQALDFKYDVNKTESRQKVATSIQDVLAEMRIARCTIHDEITEG